MGTRKDMALRCASFAASVSPTTFTTAGAGAAAASRTIAAGAIGQHRVLASCVFSAKMSNAANGRVKIWHNPSCSKSRAALAFLEEHDVDVDVVDYNQDPPTAEEIAVVLEALNLDRVEDAMRTGDAAFGEAEAAHPNLHADPGAAAAAMAAFPSIIQRPVVIRGDTKQAVIGRPGLGDVASFLGVAEGN